MAVLSLAAQPLVDVERDHRLRGPCSLFLLPLAESGERKSTCDGYFADVIGDWEREQAERMQPEVEAATNMLATWNAKRAGKVEAIKLASKNGRGDPAGLEADLQALGAEPRIPRVPVLKQADTTPEGLAFALATEWPSAGVMSDEAGLVLGSHGMQPESVLRNLALLNKLWDGGSHRVKRRTSESFTVQGARLTISLLSQPAALREFVAKTGELARGTGFFARFLLCQPESTQGYRPYSAPPAAWPDLDRFKARVRDLLDTPHTLAEDGTLSPTLLPFAPAGKAIWEEAFNAVERELRVGGDCVNVRDVASKSLDNAARLAGLFHLLANGPGGAINATDAARGVKLALWHLYEARRLFSQIAPPTHLADAAKLVEWLIDREAKGQRLGTREASQSGPARNHRFDPAFGELVAKNRVREVREGKQRLIVLNPSIVA